MLLCDVVRGVCTLRCPAAVGKDVDRLLELRPGGMSLGGLCHPCRLLSRVSRLAVLELPAAQIPSAVCILG